MVGPLGLEHYIIDVGLEVAPNPTLEAPPHTPLVGGSSVLQVKGHVYVTE